ncbi:hypothetical protein ACIS_00168 [Anaplasma centrale str. Israel]|uniref:Uncharacterized protein n=1 Tax=Anaplasma centrale (strain Israel) TaxID=574556 RepID=D1ATH7_ANACI|nr:hypothetical protein [Anaplasma centrale]ACZ48855.1 hypothetical protein ACIS_00168 [Anaplasma centrale str. Israel]
MSFGVMRLKKPGMYAGDSLSSFRAYPQVQQSIFLNSSSGRSDLTPDTYMDCVQCSACCGAYCEDQDKEK